MSSSQHTEYAAEHCRMESRALRHIKAALRVTLDWKVPEVGVPRKMSSVRFTLQSFRRHLERLMNLEEEDGYLEIVGESKPHWSPQIELLRAEHDQFRAELRDIEPEIEAVPEHDTLHFNDACNKLVALLHRIDHHDEKEADLLQEALTLDDGGQG